MSGSLLVVSAPSGAGKTSLIAKLRQIDPNVTVAVSHTTRPMRPGEQDGVHYHFVSEGDFVAMADAGAFVESARVFDHYYGTSVAELERLTAAGQDVILEIDWQGARQVRARFPGIVSVFILPPSRDELRRRLHGRGQDKDEVIERRLRDAAADMRHHEEFDYLIFNEVFDIALAGLQAVVQALRLSAAGQRERHADRLRDLTA